MSIEGIFTFLSYFLRNGIMERISQNYLMLIAFFLALVFIGCAKKEKEEAKESSTPSNQKNATVKTVSPTSTSPSSNDLSTIEAKNTETLKAMNEGKDIEPLSTDTLKGFLPNTLAGMERSLSDARQMGLVGINVASARADYDATSDTGSLTIRIMDLGNISGPMRLGMTGWTINQFDRKTDTGYEKTTTFKDHKSLEKYDNQDQHGELHVFAGDRFVVEITGDNVTMETIKQAMGQIDLKKLVETAK